MLYMNKDEKPPLIPFESGAATCRYKNVTFEDELQFDSDMNKIYKSRKNKTRGID